VDNFQFEMTGEGDHILVEAMKLVFNAAKLVGVDARHDIKGVTHYAIREAVEGITNEMTGGWLYNNYPRPKRMVFLQHNDHGNKDLGDQVAFPFVMDAVGAADFARRWLSQVDYGREPDHDGDNAKGWKLYNEEWGRVDSDSSAVIAVAPVWAMYGK